jgi:nucleotide-binding universal stress UspA family protein
MFKSILAPLTGFGSDRSVLDAAFSIARLGGGHVDCLHTRIDPIEVAALIGATSEAFHSSLRDTAQRIAREETGRSAHCKIAFTEAVERFSMPVLEAPGQDGDASASLIETTTLLNETLQQSRVHELAVLTRVAELSSERLHTIVMRAGRPVLITPSKPANINGESVVVAWKDGAESARALTAAMPLLSRAKQVTIVSISENATGDNSDLTSAEAVARQLRWHGIAAKVEMSYAPTVSAARKIEEIALGLDANLIVMGAYGHSRMREMVFGGVTREILSNCAVPVMMMH